MGRKRIGLQTSQLDYGYGAQIWQGAVARAKKRDTDLIVFPGRNLDAPHGFDYQYNVIYSLMSRQNLDALILVTTLISNYIDEAELREFCSRFEGLPLVSVGMRIPGVPSLLIDNRSGIRGVVRHMATRHAARRIAFIRGPESHWEANERYLAYREELESLELPFEESLVAEADFTPYRVRPAIESILRRNAAIPDAIVFANDVMAIEGARILRDKGIRIPSDTRIAGFDDIAEAAVQTTPLTSIRQPLFEMGYRAFEMALEMADGDEAPEMTVLPAEPVFRSSCGCLTQCVDDLRALDLAVRGLPAAGGVRAACLELAMSALRSGDFENVGDIDAREIGIEALLDGLLAACAPDDGGGGRDEGVDRLLSVFGNALEAEARSGMRPGEWQYIVPVVSDAIERILGGEADSGSLRFVARACALLAADVAQAARSAAGYETSRYDFLLLEAQYELSSIMRIEDLGEALKTQLSLLGIPSFAVSRYEKEWLHHRGTPWDIPATSRLAGGFADGVDLAPPGAEQPAYLSSLLPPLGLPDAGARKTLAVYPLFFRETHYGTIAYEMTRRDGLVYESLTTQVSAILKAISLFDSKEKAEDNLRKAMEELESFNQQLSNLSLTDELTGMYNRRGFMKLASQQLSLTKQMGKNALLIYADVDGLKTINDSYGHEEGDFAIRSAGEILRKVFRTMDVVARLGGDEFTVFASNTNEKQIGFFQSKITELLDAFNGQSGKPYTLALSLGCAECAPYCEATLGDYMREADSMLYARKAERKRSRGAAG